MPLGDSTEEDLDVLLRDLRFVEEPEGEDSVPSELTVDLKDWDLVGERVGELLVEPLLPVLYIGLLFQVTGDFCAGDSAVSFRGLEGGVAKLSDASLSLRSVFWRINFLFCGESATFVRFLSSDVCSSALAFTVPGTDLGDDSFVAFLLRWCSECLWTGGAWGDIW